MKPPANSSHQLRAGMVGLGMIFDDTYRPLFEQLHADGLYRRDFGPVEVELAAVASRTGVRGERYRGSAAGRVGPFVNCKGPDAVGQLLAQGVDAVCVATPDDRHFDAARRTGPPGTRSSSGWCTPTPTAGRRPSTSTRAG